MLKRFSVAIVASFVIVSCGSTEGAEDFLLCSANGAPTVTLESEFFDGELAFSGVVSLPDDTENGRAVQLTVQQLTGGDTAASEIAGSVSTTSTKQVKYRVTGAAAGTYQVRLRVDQTGNGVFGDVGDYEGYYPGTLEAPVTDAGSAGSVTVGESGATCQNFAVGEI